MSLKTLIGACAGLAMAALASQAQAADISAAGATFPYPIYAKWAAAYKGVSGTRPELSVHRLRRRHRPDQGKDRDVWRLRHAADAEGS